MMGITDESGNYLYVDLKPQALGYMDVGVYTDAQCIQDYTGEESHLALIEKEYKNNNDDGDGQDDDDDLLSLETYIEKWNDAFNIFKYCQPCRAYDLGWNTDLTEGEIDRADRTTKTETDLTLPAKMMPVTEMSINA
jgi:hypothetical protein